MFPFTVPFARCLRHGPCNRAHTPFVNTICICISIVLASQGCDARPHQAPRSFWFCRGTQWTLEHWQCRIELFVSSPINTLVTRDVLLLLSSPLNDKLVILKLAQCSTQSSAGRKVQNQTCKCPPFFVSSRAPPFVSSRVPPFVSSRVLPFLVAHPHQQRASQRSEV